MSKNSSVKEDEDDAFDEIEIDDDYEDIDNGVSVVAAFDARRRLEQLLEEKALERLINGDFYDYR